MKINHCEYDLGTEFVENCDDCRRTRFNQVVPYHVGNGLILYVTYMYEMRNCLQGFTGGDFLNAMSLLPCEEQEVEVVQKHKYEHALHQQQSVESHFETEVTKTMRDQWSLSHDFNTNASGGGGIDLGIFQVGASASVSASVHMSASFFNEVVQKASSSVSNYYEVSIDTKTEIENQYRSLRKISNPNKCRVVTYIFKQLGKKYTFEVVFLGMRFDLIRHLPDIHVELLPYHVTKPRFVADVNQPQINHNFNPYDIQRDAQANSTTFRTASRSQVPLVHVQVQDAYRTRVYRDVTLAKELDEASFIAKVETLKLDKNDRSAVLSSIKELKEVKGNEPGQVIYHTEYCVRTSSIVVEPKVSSCSICACEECCGCGGCGDSGGCGGGCSDGDGDQGDADIKALEIERLKVEIELLKKQLDKG